MGCRSLRCREEEEEEEAGVESRIGCNAAVVARGVASDDAGETTSSSIGKESESTSAVGPGSRCQEESDEVQSSYKEPLCALNALEESLPIRYYYYFSLWLVLSVNFVLI